MTKSTHKAEVVPVVLQPHPNADSLSIVRVFGYTVCVNTKQWEGIDKGVYVVPDSLVDVTRPEFSFLDTDKLIECPLTGVVIPKMVRVKVKKLRGVVSMGLLIPAPPFANIGDDLAEYYGIERYEPPLDLTMGDDNCGGPPGVCAFKYDIDSYHRYLDLFEDGEPVYISEKIHGANGKYVFSDGEFYCGSRTQWKKEKDTNIWWRALNNHLNLRMWLKNNPSHVVYGEVYGQVQNLKYDLNDVHFRPFDVLTPDGKFLDVEPFMREAELGLAPIVPTLELGWSLDKSKVLEYAEGKSLIANHVREGCVIKPMVERYDESIGRVCLKIVGNGYYEKVK